DEEQGARRAESETYHEDRRAFEHRATQQFARAVNKSVSSSPDERHQRRHRRQQNLTRTNLRHIKPGVEQIVHFLPKLICISIGRAGQFYADTILVKAQAALQNLNLTLPFRCVEAQPAGRKNIISTSTYREVT
ncbi:MAG: hypothetical protein ACRCZ5_08595, partial [Burkholderiales bacterium]